MCPGADVFLHIREEHVAQVPLADYHAMIKTLPANFVARHLLSAAATVCASQIDVLSGRSTPVVGNSANASGWQRF
jgi:hypothetical protein